MAFFIKSKGNYYAFSDDSKVLADVNRFKNDMIKESLGANRNEATVAREIGQSDRIDKLPLDGEMKKLNGFFKSKDSFENKMSRAAINDKVNREYAKGTELGKMLHINHNK